MCTHRCDDCHRDIVLDEHEQAWLKASGQTFYCSYCSATFKWPMGSLDNARRLFVATCRTMTAMGANTDRYANLYHAERRRNAALRGVITKLKKAK